MMVPSAPPGGAPGQIYRAPFSWSFPGGPHYPCSQLAKVLPGPEGSPQALAMIPSSLDGGWVSHSLQPANSMSTTFLAEPTGAIPTGHTRRPKCSLRRPMTDEITCRSRNPLPSSGRPQWIQPAAACSWGIGPWCSAWLSLKRRSNPKSNFWNMQVKGLGGPSCNGAFALCIAASTSSISPELLIFPSTEASCWTIKNKPIKKMWKCQSSLHFGKHIALGPGRRTQHNLARRLHYVSWCERWHGDTRC